MKTIRLTRALRSAIYQAAKKEVDGANPLFEVGYRAKVGTDDHALYSLPPRSVLKTTENMRLWEEDADLVDLCRLAHVETLELDETGRCELDLYARTGIGDHRQLETNVYVLLDATGVLDTSSVGRTRHHEWDEPERPEPARAKPSELRAGMVTAHGYEVTHDAGWSSPRGRIVVGVRYVNGDEGVREWRGDEPFVILQL